MKIVITLILTTFLVNLGISQINIGINSKVIVPQQNVVEVDGGYGLGISVGYLIKKRVNIQIGLDNKRIATILSGNQHIRGVGFDASYLFLEKKFRPYLGIGANYNQRSLALLGSQKFKENSIGFTSYVGFINHFKKVENLAVKMDFYYQQINMRNLNAIYGIQIGVIYSFPTLN